MKDKNKELKSKMKVIFQFPTKFEKDETYENVKKEVNSIMLSALQEQLKNQY